MHSSAEKKIKSSGSSSEELEKCLISAMMEPSFYPTHVSEVVHLETHISHVFLVDDLVYKIKKPVRFSFLDYSTLTKRVHYLHEELRLNRRFAPSVYLGVLPISHDRYGWHLGSDVHPAEYTLVMRRLPEKRMLDFLLERGRATSEMMSSLAEVLAGFHLDAPTGGRINTAGEPEVIQKVWDENLADVRSFIGRYLDVESYAMLQTFGRAFILKHQELLRRRIRERRIRDGHGDLHCEHICFAPEGIQIFDCIEFSPKLRYGDVASEVAFLTMDMELRGADFLARQFLERYVEHTKDPELSMLLPYYKCHRALVRGKVTALRSRIFSQQAAQYFEYACRLIWEAWKPFLVLIGGLSGSGKSTLARALNERTGWPVVSSDATRKDLAGVSGRQDRIPYGEGIYSASMSEITYQNMAEQAEAILAQGQAVILDATFLRTAQRERMIGLAAKKSVPVLFIWCQSSDSEIQTRLKKRLDEGRDLSDARWEIYLRQKTDSEPMGDVSEGRLIVLNADAGPQEVIQKAERYLRRALTPRI